MSISHHLRPTLIFIVLLVLVLVLIAESTAHAQLPSHWDWRSSLGPNLVSGVRNQGSCGNCYILMPLEMIESREMITAYRAGIYLPDINYSEQYIMSCGSGYFGDFDCGGGFPHDTSVFVQEVGVPLESCYVYDVADESCPSSCPDEAGEIVLHQIPGPAEYYSNYPTEQWIMQEVYDNGPVAVMMQIYSDFYSFSGGIYEHVTGTLSGGKSMLIVGWGTEGSTPYWIVKNSWGPGWGDDGFFRIARNANHANCEFAEWVYTATVGMPTTAVDDLPTSTWVRDLEVYPNPFNPRTVISFGVPETGHVRLEVYDLGGRLVRVLVDRTLDSTTRHSVNWDGRDHHGRQVTSGVYLARVQGPSLEATHKMALIR